MSAVPLQAQGDMHIGMVTHKKVLPSRLGAIYREASGTVYATENIIDKKYHIQALDESLFFRVFFLLG